MNEKTMFEPWRYLGIIGIIGMGIILGAACSTFTSMSRLIAETIWFITFLILISLFFL
jgi:hypothetical protein